jgi:hypothetical protein
LRNRRATSGAAHDSEHGDHAAVDANWRKIAGIDEGGREKSSPPSTLRQPHAITEPLARAELCNGGRGSSAVDAALALTWRFSV